MVRERCTDLHIVNMSLQILHIKSLNHLFEELFFSDLIKGSRTLENTSEGLVTSILVTKHSMTVMAVFIWVHLTLVKKYIYCSLLNVMQFVPPRLLFLAAHILLPVCPPKLTEPCMYISVSVVGSQHGCCCGYGSNLGIVSGTK